MADDIIILINAITVVFSAAISAFSWMLYRRYNGLPVWLPVAFIFMLLNRLVILADVTGQFQEYNLQLRYIGAGCFLIFSGFFLYSIWQVKRESDELLQSNRQAMKTIIEFEKKRRRTGTALLHKFKRTRTGERKQKTGRENG